VGRYLVVGPFFFFRAICRGCSHQRVQLNGPSEALTSVTICALLAAVFFFSTARAIPCENPGMALVGGVPFSKLPRAKQHAIFVAQRKQRTTPAEKCSPPTSLRSAFPIVFSGDSTRHTTGIADFYLPSLNIIIEIDGPCHDPAKNQRRDTLFEQTRGIRTLRLSNEQVFRGEFATIKKFIAKTADAAR
jgi:Protein of unknown function (DUF559)